MKKYGGTLREIREQKGYSMQQLASGILSVSFLSKFERGESDISFAYITRLLERLSLSFEEFFYLHEGVRPDQLEYYFDRSEEHTSELQSRFDLVCRLLLEKKNYIMI